MRCRKIDSHHSESWHSLGVFGKPHDLLAKDVYAKLPNDGGFDAKERWPAIENQLAKVRRESNLQNYIFKYTVKDPSLGPQALFDLRDEDHLEDLIEEYLENQAPTSSLIVPLILVPPEQQVLEPLLPHVWTPPTSIDEDALGVYVHDKTFINVQLLHKLRVVQTEPVEKLRLEKLWLTLADADLELA